MLVFGPGLFLVQAVFPERGALGEADLVLRISLGLVFAVALVILGGSLWAFLGTFDLLHLYISQLAFRVVSGAAAWQREGLWFLPVPSPTAGKEED